MPKPQERRSGVLGALLGLVGFSGLAGLLVAIMVTPAIAVTGMTANNAVGIFNELPEYATLGDDLAQKVTLYGMRGETPEAFATIFETNREEVGWDQVSQFAKDAAVYGEDARFYEHGGVDVRSLGRAVVDNLTAGGVASGGSTITMQVIRNINIEAANQIEDPDERRAAYEDAVAQSFDRKLKEMKLAIGVEKQYDKQTILLAYLNIANFGGTTYGIQAASQRYFGINAIDLTPAQAASLIAIVQYPNSRSLEKEENYPANQVRRDYILGEMLEYGALSQEQYAEAIATPVSATLQPLNNGCMSATTAKYYCDFIVKTLLNDEAFGETADERRQGFRKGYDIYTTLNLDMQSAAEAAMTQWVPSTDSRFQIGSATVGVEPGTGRVLYMTQNTQFNDTADGGGPGTTSVNFATDFDRGGSSGFQPGSLFKIFTLGQWLQAGHGLNEVVRGSANTWRQNAFTRCGAPMSGPDWQVKNDGPSSARISATRATATSNNNAFIDMARQLDLCDIQQTAQDLGMHTATGAKDGSDMMTQLSSVIGGSDDRFAPLTVANAFAAVSARGLTCTPIGIDRATTPGGQEIPVPKANCRQSIDPMIADGMIHAMKQAARGGTVTGSVPTNSVPIFGKTGSTDSYNQTWSAVATTEVAAVTWVGNIEGSQSMSRTTVNRTSASLLRHRINNQLFTQWQRMFGGGDWPPADQSFLTGNNIPVPDLTGQSFAAAQQLLEALDFTVTDGGQVESDLDIGLVARSEPGAGASLPRGSDITLYTSDGSLRTTVPEVIGEDVEDAVDALTDAGFSASSISYEYIAGPPGQVCRVGAVSPGEGTQTSKAAPIRLTVSAITAGTDPGC